MNPLALRSLLLAHLLAALALASGCGGATDPTEQSADDAGQPEQVEQPDASAAVPADAGVAADAAVDKAAACAAEFGTSLTNAFGRLDGTVLAVVKPTDTQCPQPNADHLVIQMRVGGEAYRMVVNVLSDGRNGTDTRMKYFETSHALLGEPWAEGWHPGASLDYPGDLGAHVESFAPHEMGELVELVAARLELGERISIFATSKDRPSSAHLVHRNPSTSAPDDGAIVIGPDSADPLYLLFCWDGTTF